MFYYLKKSSRKIIHYSGCRYFAKHTADGFGVFETLEAAHTAGYRLCKCCTPIAQRYHKEKKEIMTLCATEGLSCYQSDGRIHVQTPRSQWQIITAGKKNTLFLYHKNTDPKRIDAIESILPGYHSQAVRKTSICDYLKFIVEHDTYRRFHPEFKPHLSKADRPAAQKGTKRWKKEQRRDARYKKRSAVSNVINLIDQLQAAAY